MEENTVHVIAKALLRCNVIFLLAVAFVVLLGGYPNISPNITRTCLPNRDDTLVSFILCGPTEERMDSFITDVLEKKYKQITEREKKIREKQFARKNMKWSNSDIIPSMKPAAKLIGKKVQLNMTQGMIPIDTWCTGVELDLKGGFLRKGVRYYKGRLVVPVPGTYYVYSFVEFYEPCFYKDGTPNVDNRKDPFKLALFKYSIIDGKNEEITGSAQPHKIAKNKYENVYSSHISTVVDLKAGDELSVQFNNVSLLSKYAGDNYFGLGLIE